jgi:putative tryptophan/tyrosine transport system substrate-binding protein
MHLSSGRIEHYADLAREVIHRNPDLILVSSVRIVQSFKAATATIPIVGLI